MKNFLISSLTLILLGFAYAFQSEYILKLHIYSFIVFTFSIIISNENWRYKITYFIVCFSFVFWFYYPAIFLEFGGLNEKTQHYLIFNDFVVSFYIINGAIAFYFLMMFLLRCNLNFTRAIFSYIPPKIDDGNGLYRVTLVLFVLGTLTVFTGGLDLRNLISVFTVGSRNITGVVGSNVATSMGDSVNALFSSFLLSSTILSTFMVFGNGKYSLSRRKRYIIVAIFLSSLSILVLGGNRSRIILVVLPIMLALFLVSRNKIKIFLYLTPLILMIVVLSQVMMHSRAGGFENIDVKKVAHNIFTLNGTLDFISESAFAVSKFSDPREQVYESNILIFATALVPRTIYPGKPTTKVIEKYVEERWGINILRSGGNVFPGINGQFYISDGLFSPISLALFLAFVSLISIKLMPEKIDFYIYEVLLACLLLAWLFSSMRVLAPGLSYPILFIYVGMYFNKFRI